jgi:hypothetical protein
MKEIGNVNTILLKHLSEISDLEGEEQVKE